MKYANKLRHQKPRIYNKNRLFERPIPFIGNVRSNDTSDSDSSDLLENDDNNGASGSHETSQMEETMVSIETINVPAIDPLANSIKAEEAYIEMNESDRAEIYAFLHLSGEQIDESGNNNLNIQHEHEQNESIAAATVSNATGDWQVDEIYPVSFSSNTTNTNAAENLVDPILSKENESSAAENLDDIADENNDVGVINSQNQNDSIDEIEFISIDVFGLPQPIKNVTPSGLTKQENDVLSGNLPYAIKVITLSLTFNLHFLFCKT